jgi:putative transposase
VTIKLDPSGRWFVSLLVDVDIDPLPASPNKVGLDLGVSSLVTLSTGEKIANPKTFQAK